MKAISIIVLGCLVTTLAGCGEGEVAVRDAVDAIFIRESSELTTLDLALAAARRVEQDGPKMAKVGILQDMERFDGPPSREADLSLADRSEKEVDKALEREAERARARLEKNQELINTLYRFKISSNAYTRLVEDNIQLAAAIEAYDKIRIRDFMNDFVFHDPETGDLRSDNWRVVENNDIIYIMDESARYPSVYRRADQRPLNKLFHSLKKKADASICVDVDSGGKVSIGIHGKLEGGVPLEINFNTEDGIEAKAVFETGFLGGRDKKPTIKLGHEVTLPVKKEDGGPVMHLSSSTCYPFGESQVQITVGGHSLTLTPKDVSIEL